MCHPGVPSNTGPCFDVDSSRAWIPAPADENDAASASAAHVGDENDDMMMLY
jgi:hypothetical protein